MGATIKSFKRETCTGKWREWQLRKVISRNDLPFHYTLVSSSLNPGIRASQSSKHASKQASAQSVICLFHGPAPRSPLRGSPNSIHVHDHVQNCHHSRQDARTKSCSRRAFVNNDFVLRESVESERRDEKRPECSEMRLERGERRSLRRGRGERRERQRAVIIPVPWCFNIL